MFKENKANHLTLITRIYITFYNFPKCFHVYFSLFLFNKYILATYYVYSANLVETYVNLV